ncbi:MAG TPA: biotin/lipoyl-containing protein, partial [Candidatus Krumholzibacteria bacterium]|nr:biotin/lipoyl-containing protein [Candidatus Krumholzibacteria bacterium]
MIVEIKLPEISENVDSGDVVKVLVSQGENVAVEQPLIELETEKAVFEVPSTAAGVVSEIRVKAGDTIKVGDVIARIDTEAATDAPAPKPAAPAPESKAKSPAPPAAPVEEVATGEDGTETLREAVVAVAQEQGAPVPASPTVRRLARELGIEIHRVGGTGPGGRISSDDVHAYARSIIAGARAGAAPAAGVAPSGAAPRALPDFARFGAFERTPMSKVRQITAQSMAGAWNTVPHV